MKFIRFEHQGRVATGLWLGDRALDLPAAARLAGDATDLSSLPAIIRGGDAALNAVSALANRTAQLTGALLPADGVRLLAPLPLARNAFCVGLNYTDHVREGAAVRKQEFKLPEVPTFFTKATHALNGPRDAVRLDPRVTGKFDYEAELAVVIGRGGRDIPVSSALDHVFGYTVANDFTARDLQRRHDQWFKGKSLDTTLPLGPWVVAAAEIGDPKTLEISLTVNGEERQRARASQMIFDIPAIIAALSAGLTLEAGDVILTGTPSGVGVAMTPPRLLQDGDVVVTRIDRIGELINRIVAVK